MPKEIRKVMGTVTDKGKLAGDGGIVKGDRKTQKASDKCANWNTAVILVVPGQDFGLCSLWPQSTASSSVENLRSFYVSLPFIE